MSQGYSLIDHAVRDPNSDSSRLAVHVVDREMHTSRYSGYHINANRDVNYITDGEESHRAPSDRTMSEYVVANEHTTMVITPDAMNQRKYLFKLKAS